MNKFAPLLLALALALVAQERAGIDGQMGAHNPLREVDGKKINLRPLFDSQRDRRPFPAQYADWKRLSGHIESVAPDRGVLLRSIAPRDVLLWVTNYPTSIAKDEQIIIVYAKYVGIQRINTSGGTKSLDCYDYGRIMTAAEFNRAP